MGKPEPGGNKDVFDDNTVSERDSVAEIEPPRRPVQPEKPPMTEPQPERIAPGGGTKR